MPLNTVARTLARALRFSPAHDPWRVLRTAAAGGGGGHGSGRGRAWLSSEATGGIFLDRQQVLDRVMNVVKNFEKVETGKVTPESHFVKDLALDSLDTVELVMALEDEFAIEIPDAAAEKILSVPDAVEYVANNAHAK
ncbi:hypothetical protein CDCA_CDCA06G1842 [Cyanidium caldarium]|uniref:Acyl carrier protein n=1 Tax=Cyanidium caldarium TaxID=2771 RepID=A0AAV9IU09_CYACA|nr:hypothetical protein CDCA_CDCA06G1842 [Cyanidium caldarium]